MSYDQPKGFWYSIRDEMTNDNEFRPTLKIKIDPIKGRLSVRIVQTGPLLAEIAPKDDHTIQAVTLWGEKS